MSTSTVCPWCSAPFPGPVTACPRCGIPLTGPAALALLNTDRQLTVLQAHRRQLLDQLWRSAADPGHRLGQPRQGLAGPEPQPTTLSIGRDQAPPARTSHAWAGQRLLLGAGALLVVTAAAVFLAVTWSALGVGGQVGVMGVLTALCAAVSFRTARRGPRATAETLAALTVALAVVDASAAYALNLSGVRTWDLAAYFLAVSALLAAASAAAAFVCSSTLTYRLSAVGASAAVPGLFVSAVDPLPVVGAFILLVAAVAFTVARAGLRGAWATMRRPATLVGGGYLLAGWVLSFWAVVDEPDLVQAELAAVSGLATVVVAGWAGRLHHGLTAAVGRPVPAVAAIVAWPVIVVAAVWRADESGFLVLVLGAAAAALGGALGQRQVRAGSTFAGVIATLAVLVGVSALVVGQMSAIEQPSTPTRVWAALTVAYAIAAVAAVGAGFRRRTLRVAAFGCASLLAQLSVAAATYPSGTFASVAGASAASVVVAVAAGRCRGRAAEWVLAGSWVVAVLTAIGYPIGATGGLRMLATALATAGLTALAYGLLPRRGNVAVAGALLCTGAVWAVLADASVTVVEAYSLPLAALVAVVGLVRLYRDRTSSSWLTVGPALSAALVPSALATLDDDGLARPLLVLASGVVVLVGGVLLRWQSPVVAATLSLTIVSVSQLAPYAVGLPRWLSFGLAGLLLLALGARYEQRYRDVRQAARWLTALR